MGGGWGGVVQAVIRAVGSGRWSFARLLARPRAAYLWLYGLVPNRLRTGTGPRPGGWGLLLLNSSFAAGLDESIQRAFSLLEVGKVVTSLPLGTHLPSQPGFVGTG